MLNQGVLWHILKRIRQQLMSEEEVCMIVYVLSRLSACANAKPGAPFFGYILLASLQSISRFEERRTYFGVLRDLVLVNQVKLKLSLKLE